MSRKVVFLLIGVTIALFVFLLSYGWVNRWGGVGDSTVPEDVILAMPLIEDGLELVPDVFSDELWERLAPVSVTMLHQITTAPTGKNLIPTIDVRAFHDGENAYFLLEWKDEVESREHILAKFPDAVAVAFSLGDNEESRASIMMGFTSPMNFWQWKANLDAEFWNNAEVVTDGFANKMYSYESQAEFPSMSNKATNACQDILASRPGSVTVKKNSILAGRGQWEDGKWRVIIKRAIVTTDKDSDVQLQPGQRRIAFAVWDGDKGDRGSRKSISDWVVLDIKTTGPVAASGPSASKGDGCCPDEVTASSAHEDQSSFSLLPSAHASSIPENLPEGIEPRVITIKAKRFEYNPGQITVQKGEWITLRLESLDVTHGLFLDGYAVNIKASPGKIGKATFLADKTGRFSFRCSETCGEFHPYMIGFMSIEPNSRFNAFVFAVVAAAVLIFVILTLKLRNKGGVA